jgi:hypothetical protein
MRQGLDWMNGLIALTHSHSSKLQAVLHTFQFTVAHALGISSFTSRILATNLSQSRCLFKSHMKSSFHSLVPLLSLFCNCQFRRLDSIQFLCSQAHIPAAGVSKSDSLLDNDAWSPLLNMLFYNSSGWTIQKT